MNSLKLKLGRDFFLLNINIIVIIPFIKLLIMKFKSDKNYILN